MSWGWMKRKGDYGFRVDALTRGHVSQLVFVKLEEAVVELHHFNPSFNSQHFVYVSVNLSFAFTPQG